MKVSNEFGHRIRAMIRGDAMGIPPYTTHNDDPTLFDKIHGGLQGYCPVTTRYAELCHAFGPPDTKQLDDHKMDWIWVVEWPDGLVADIYNWKDGPNSHRDEDDHPDRSIKPTDIEEWNIGGDKGVVERIHKILLEVID